MSGLLSENLISLSGASRKLKNNPATIWRWVAHGIARSDGARVRLEAIRLGGRWLTSEQAIERFAVAQRPPSEPVQLDSKPSVARCKRSEAVEAARELEAMGA